jgi:predicted ATPase
MLEASVFVGQEPELAQLYAAFEEASTGLGGVAMVSGDSGIGKTRLVHAGPAQLVRDGSAE